MKRPLVVFLFLCFGWKFVKSEDASSVDCKLFKVRTEDTSESSGYKDNDTSKYTHELKGLLKNQPLYKFNTGTKFLALLYNDEFVWQHTSSHDPNKFPEELEIDPYNNTLWIKYGGMDFLTFKFENDKWKHSGDLSYGQCKGVTIPDYNATSVPSTPASPPAEEKVAEEEPEEESEKAEEEAEPEAEEKPAEEATEVVSVDGEEKTEDAEPEKPDEGAPVAEDAEEKAEDAAEAEEAHAEEPHVAPDEGEAAKPAEAGTDGDAPADPEAAPVPEGEDASPSTEVVPESAAPETHDDGDKAPDAAPAAVPEAPEEDASKPDGDVSEATTDAGLESEEAEAVVDDLLLSNLYPVDLTGSFHCGLRGTLFDEDVKQEPEEADASGSHVASDADAAKPADEGSTAAADSEEKTEEPEKASEEPEAKSEEADKAADTDVKSEAGELEEHKDKEDKEKLTEEMDVSAAPDSKPKAETSATVDEDKEEAHVTAGKGEEGAKPADATVAEPAEGDDSSKAPDSDAAPAPAAEVEDASKAADASTTPDADNGGMKEAFLKLEHEGKLLKMFTQSDDDSAQAGSSDGKFNFELENNVLSAKFKEGVKCVKLEYEEKEVWKHDEAKHGTKHPTEVRFDTQSLEVVLTFDDKSKFTYKYDTKSNAHAFALSSVPLDMSERPAKLKFFKDANGNDEIGDAEFSLAKESDGTKEFVVHSFNDGVKCLLVKYDGKDVWEYDTDFKENYPASVHYNKDDHELRVFVRANWFYFYKFDTTKNEHDIYREKEPADVASE